MEWVVEMFHFIKEWWFIIAGIISLLMAGYKGVETINDTLKDIRFELKTSNLRFEQSEHDRKKLWERVFKNDEAIDRLANITSRHDAEIENLKKR